MKVDGGKAHHWLMCAAEGVGGVCEKMFVCHSVTVSCDVSVPSLVANRRKRSVVQFLLHSQRGWGCAGNRVRG